MEDNSTIPFDQFKLSSNSQIPFDLFVSKKYKGIGIRGFVKFTDSAKKLVYTVQKSSYKSDTRDQDCVKQLLDSSGNTLFSIIRLNNIVLPVEKILARFKGNGEEKKVIFTVDKTVDEFNRTEFTVILVDENNEDGKTELRMKGSPYKRSCTIYKGDSIVAQTSLMYKLGIGKIFIPRNRFRVTIFPGFADHSLIACLIAIYFDGRKLWI